MRIDAHTHIFPASFAQRRTAADERLLRDDTFRETYQNPKARMATAKELVATLDEADFDAAVVAGIGWTDLDLAREANDYALESAQKFPGRVLPFCSVNPAWGDAALREVERCADAGALGVGELHPDTQDFLLSDPKFMRPLGELLRERGLVLLTHTSEPVGHLYRGKGRATPEQVMGLVRLVPGLQVICAHWGGGLPFYALMPEVAADLQQSVYFDSAASPYLYQPDVFSTVVKLVGADKVLFASDFPLLKPSRAMKDLEASGMGAGMRKKLLGENAARLLKLPRTARRAGK
ncbi:MAG: amidohydrolase [Dehalococcoidia bacterium]|nr:amidohydrolase [Dehalococcoidia bacterium]